MKKTKVLLATSSVLLVLVISLLFVLKHYTDRPVPPVDVNQDEPFIIKETEPGIDYVAIWKENQDKCLNKEDYIGQISFESKLIDLPIVQGETNDTYLRHNIAGEYDIEGSIFLDYRNNIDEDQNIILYGHNTESSYDNTMTKKFSPLHHLEDQNKYEENKYIDLILEDRLERYVIVSIYRCGIYEGEDGNQYVMESEPQYYWTNYDESYFNEYKSKVKSREFYNTGEDYKYEDRLLTLQTCFEGSLDKLIVIAKLQETTFHQ